jgi:hypothetical protein
VYGRLCLKLEPERQVSRVQPHEALATVDLSPQQSRMVWNAVVNSAIEESVPTEESVRLLCDFVAEKISAKEHLARVLARAGVRARHPLHDQS